MIAAAIRIKVAVDGSFRPEVTDAVMVRNSPRKILQVKSGDCAPS
jgi:hypothetical protein